MPNTNNKTNRKSPYITAAVHSATGTGLTLLPRHAIRFSSSASSKDVFAGDDERAMSMLNNAIYVVTIAKEFVEINAVKGVLSGVCAILIIVQDTKSNKSALAELAMSCVDTCLALKRGTVGKTEDDISPAVSAAISDLTRTMKDIRENIAKTARRHSLAMMFHSKSNKDMISGWDQALSRVTAVFNTELHVITSLKVEDIHDRLVDAHQDIGGKLDDMHQNVKVLVDLHTTSVPKDVSLSGEHSPPPPKLFFGRERLVEQTSEWLKGDHVALIGPGGIGKTSIAKTILHHPSIKDHFKCGIFFVRCDDLLVSHDNLLNRIGKIIGISLSQSNPLNPLRAYFSSCSEPLLLVLDNAETILDAATDKDLIAEFMDELVSFTNVCLLLTTRTTMLPNNASWRRIQVPPLNEDAARQAFYAVYNDRGSSDSQAIDGLLKEVDYHPLSINLLASACVRNEWMIPELHGRWRDQNIRMLDLGNDAGRLRSLSVSIELSLNSPTIRELGGSAIHVLQVIAILPQGVDQSKLSDLFPSLPNIQSIIDTMRQMSLTHCNNHFVTMLAPVRLHILHMKCSESPLLDDVRAFYFGKLRQCRGLGPFGKGSWISFEDDNVESLVACSDDSPDTCNACNDFLYLLFWHKPRKTILGDKIRGFPDGDAKSARLKVLCMQMIGMTDMSMGRYMDAREMYTTARSLALAHNDQVLVTNILRNLADVSCRSGKLSDAVTQYTETLASYRNLKNLRGEAGCNRDLGAIMMMQGNFSKAFQYLGEALAYFERKEDKRGVGTTTVLLGGVASGSANYSEARQHFDTAIAVFTDLGDHGALGTCLMDYATMEQQQKNWIEVHRHLKRAEKSYAMVNFICGTANCLSKRGQAYIEQKEFLLADRFVKRADRIFIRLGATGDHASCISYLARIEKHQHQYRKAICLYIEAKDLFAEAGDLLGQACCSLALGSIAFAEKDYITAGKWFQEAKLGYEAAGMSPQEIEKKLDSSEGWRWFRDTHLTVGDQAGAKDGSAGCQRL